MLSSAKIGRSSWRYYQRSVAGGACEYYAEHGDTPGRWHGSGLEQLGLTAGAEVRERELEALFGRALSPTTGVALGSPWRADAVTGYDLTFIGTEGVVSTLWALGDAQTMAGIDAAQMPRRSMPLSATSRFTRRCHAAVVTGATSPTTPPSTSNYPGSPDPTCNRGKPTSSARSSTTAPADPLGPLYEVAAFTGLRRGELLGLQWDDIDVERSRLTVRRQIVQLGHATHLGPVKTASGQDRVVDLDEATIGALLSHRLRQEQQRDEWGTAWVDSGHVFTKEDGSPLHPETVTKRFRELSDAAGLRPVRLHDLRHGQASLMLAAGVPMAVVSKTTRTQLARDHLGHLLAPARRRRTASRHRRSRSRTAHRPPNPE